MSPAAPLTTERARKRGARAWRIVGASLALFATALVAVTLDRRALEPEQVEAVALPGFAERMDSVRRITVRLADDTYLIERTPAGWVMTGRGGYPVRTEHLGDLARAFSEMRLTRRMTSDPEKHDRIGLGDPDNDGRGALVQMEDESGALVADLIVGLETGDGQVFVRRAGEAQAWAASPAPPQVRSVAAWLDLTPLAIPPEQIVRVDLAPAEGRGYGLIQRDPLEGQGFSFAPPLRGIVPRSYLDLQQTAAQLLAVRPVDVTTAAAVQGAPQARVVVSLNTGAVIDALVIPDGDARWLKLSARAGVDSDEARSAAAEINARVSDWAYRLTETQAQQLAPAFESHLPPPPSLP